jgi:tetratricopeptide (TPR) repeat protein
VLEHAREITRIFTIPGECARRGTQAWVLAQLGQYHRAHRYGLYAYRALRNGQDHRTVGELGVTLGVCLRAPRPQCRGDRVAAGRGRDFRRIDDSDGLVSALNTLGLVYKNLREWREATRFLEQALRIDERAGFTRDARAHT